MTKGKSQKQVKAKVKAKGGEKGKGKPQNVESLAERKRKVKKALEYLISSDSEATLSSSSSDEESSSESEEEYVIDDGGRDRTKKKNTQAAQYAPAAQYPPAEMGPPSAPPGEYDYEEQRAHSKDYFYRHVLREQYPDRLKIKPNRLFDADDCDLLATLEARQHALKYHYLQADFCNATGRMLPLALLREQVQSARPRSS